MLVIIDNLWGWDDMLRREKKREEERVMKKRKRRTPRERPRGKVNSGQYFGPTDSKCSDSQLSGTTRDKCWSSIDYFYLFFFAYEE